MSASLALASHCTDTAGTITVKEEILTAINEMHETSQGMEKEPPSVAEQPTSTSNTVTIDPQQQGQNAPPASLEYVTSDAGVSYAGTNFSCLNNKSTLFLAARLRRCERVDDFDGRRPREGEAQAPGGRA